MNHKTVWTEDAIRGLGAFTTLQTAAEIFGLSRSVAYEMAAAGTFPVPVHRVGRRGWRVPVAPILAAAGYAREPAAPDTPHTAGSGRDLNASASGASITVMKSAAHPQTRPHRPGDADGR